jgi:hypothetical protein
MAALIVLGRGRVALLVNICIAQLERVFKGKETGVDSCLAWFSIRIVLNRGTHFSAHESAPCVVLYVRDFNRHNNEHK